MKPRTRRLPLGLHPSHYTAPQRWQLDSVEYAETLPEAERQWLATFLREYYGGRRSGVHPLELQRDADRARRRNEFDVHTYEATGGRLLAFDPRRGSAKRQGDTCHGFNLENNDHARTEDDTLAELDQRRAALSYQAERDRRRGRNRG